MYNREKMINKFAVLYVVTFYKKAKDISQIKYQLSEHFHELIRKRRVWIFNKKRLKMR
jgi:hypothetical protein